MSQAKGMCRGQRRESVGAESMKVTIGRIHEEVARLDPKLLKADEESYKAAVVLLSSAQVGPNIKRIAKFARYPRATVAQFSRMLRKNRVWRGERIYTNWFDENGGVSFWLDVLAARGFVERVPAEVR